MQSLKFKFLYLWARLFKKNIVISGKISKGKTTMSKQLLKTFVANNS